ncbi:hypothetical protein L3X38_005038 [Prunus dulcis]|uniref:Uncharacterized protein n=1 Tax=Prunus dulcis TaxID=3755 RepID=A0AAD4ZPW8_PRUDU|nr:hypothetical protein L3X38_005038 [Prunus dulcis]
MPGIPIIHINLSIFSAVARDLKVPLSLEAGRLLLAVTQESPKPTFSLPENRHSVFRLTIYSYHETPAQPAMEVYIELPYIILYTVGNSAFCVACNFILPL